MRAFGLEITRAKALAPNRAAPVSENRGGWWPWVSESYAGAWQKNDGKWTNDTVLAHHAVFACVTLIANDFGKLRPRLVEQDEETRIWKEAHSNAFSPVLRKPNHFQNYIQFKEWWAMSKLLRGNAYALKERDARRVVVRQYLLDPGKVTPLVAPDGSVYYELKPDNMSGIETAHVVPASEIIHDRINCLYHPLVGTSPLFACGAGANIGLQIENSSSKFFANGSKVSGQLLIPTFIDQAKADEFRTKWESKFTGENAGQIAVLSGGMKFEPLQMTSTDAQLIEQLRWSAEAVCSAFHVPAFKIGIRDVTYANAAMANQIYYSDCLQSHIEQYELCQDEGLGIGEGVKVEGKVYGVELDLDALLRMDAAAQMNVLTQGAGGPVLTPNEARVPLGKMPLPGGDTLYRQQQEFSLEALSKRDAQDDPFATSSPTPETEPKLVGDDDDEFDAAAFLIQRIQAKRAVA